MKTTETEVRCSCGGKIHVTDFRGRHADREFRFEAYCDKCLDCDPNGWPTRERAIEEAKKFFAEKKR